MSCHSLNCGSVSLNLIQRNLFGSLSCFISKFCLINYYFRQRIYSLSSRCYDLIMEAMSQQSLSASTTSSHSFFILSQTFLSRMQANAILSASSPLQNYDAILMPLVQARWSSMYIFLLALTVGRFFELLVIGLLDTSLLSGVRLTFLGRTSQLSEVVQQFGGPVSFMAELAPLLVGLDFLMSFLNCQGGMFSMLCWKLAWLPEIELLLLPYLMPFSVMSKEKRVGQSILLAASLSNSLRIKFLVSSDTSATFGENLTVQLATLAIRLAMEPVQNGQQPQSIQNRTTPNDHISALDVQTCPFKTQGAMQIGDPNMVAVISLSSFRFLQKPKSPNFSTSLWNRIFQGFRSRCMILFLYRTLKASRSCLKQERALASGNFTQRLRRLQRVPPLQYSQTKQKLLAVRSISMNLTM